MNLTASGNGMKSDPLEAEVSRFIWESKYRGRAGDRIVDDTVRDTWRRVARAISRAEPADRQRWQAAFLTLLDGFRFLPGGRILAGAGTGFKVTLFNCFVMGTIGDSIDGIFGALREGAITMQQGGGVGYDFSSLRPRGTPARGVGSIASGPVSFMGLWDSMCATMLSTGSRRGAMMATLRCDHPDIETFVTAKQAPGALCHFNLSVQVSDAFMAAVRADREWALVFPAAGGEPPGEEVVLRDWTGREGAMRCRVHRRLRARNLWDSILRATYDHAEPGVLFIDCINRLNNLHYRERLTATNPCGEIPLPPYGACDLGSINLTQFVREPFSAGARLDEDTLAETARLATRFLDDVIDVSRFPLRREAEAARNTRRIGLGITGLADALVMLGLDYGSEEARAVATGIMRTVCLAAYRTSIELAAEKGMFPAFARDGYLSSPFIAGLPADIRDAVAKHGIRNSHLIAIAPTGSISLLANNISSGIEPAFAAGYSRNVLDASGDVRAFELTDRAVASWQRTRLPSQSRLPPAFRSAAELSPREHLLMQAALQPFVDNAISKTINVAEETSFEDFRGVYDMAYDLGLKGCTTFRVSPARAAILSAGNEGANAPHCCVMEREAD
ncbi:adenosylcobalamin-dependent ribonucleoside-diphosphate reductase [Chelativorans xinjiangense]|uniref:adenosylcobalamin-dependent ribonucleoside-diphosphate reductase n=1 Tax=Chelativorans xinjiangense TaxID=2681485 RepID=UPI00191691DC|nr:adenosylcobalamin-dependent ribonucleoside-diphosphate reductase [Chelativorans xinjiangense]